MFSTWVSDGKSILDLSLLVSQQSDGGLGLSSYSNPLSPCLFTWPNPLSVPLYLHVVLRIRAIGFKSESAPFPYMHTF